MGNAETMVVDGANIAYIEQTKDGKPKVSNIVKVREALAQRGFEPLVIIDAALHHEVDDPQQLEGMLDKQLVHQAPAGTDADYFVLEMAEKTNGRVVSNDQFTPYRDQFPWIEKRRVPLMIINGHVEFYGPALNGQEDTRK